MAFNFFTIAYPFYAPFPSQYSQPFLNCHLVSIILYNERLGWLCYSGRSLESDVDTSGVQLDPSGFGLQILECLAFFQATENYNMFCWTVKVSVISTLSICCISIGLESSPHAQNLLALLLDLNKTDLESECGSSTEQEDMPDLVAFAFIPWHLPTCVFFLTSKLPKINQLLWFMRFPIYNSDITFILNREWTSGTCWVLWASSLIALYSLVRIQQSGNYSGSLGIVMATSAEFGSKSLVVAIVPRIPYSTASLARNSPSPQQSTSHKHQMVDHPTTG